MSKADRIFEERLAIDAGAAIRGQVRREIEQTCIALGLSCEVHEGKGWLESSFVFIIRGPSRLHYVYDAIESALMDMYREQEEKKRAIAREEELNRLYPWWRFWRRRPKALS